MSPVPVFVGIDVSKDRLDIARHPTGEREAVPNAEPDIAALVARLQTCHPTLIVLEATGGFELAVTAALAAAQQPVVVVNPRQVRDFAKATGQLATRRMPSTRPSLRSSLRPCDRPCDPCRRRPRRPSLRCWPADASSSPCG